MKQFFGLLKTNSFLFFKQMLDADAALDGKPIDFKVFQFQDFKFFSFIYFLLKVNFIEICFN